MLRHAGVMCVKFVDCVCVCALSVVLRYLGSLQHA